MAHTARQLDHIGDVKQAIGHQHDVGRPQSLVRAATAHRELRKETTIMSQATDWARAQNVAC